MSNRIHDNRGVRPREFWRSVGVWLAAVAVAYQLLNSIRAFVDPVGLAENYGVPSENAAFVCVYGIRTLFIGLFGLTLLLRRDLLTLVWFAATAIVLPIGDAILVASFDGPTGTVVRHALTAVALALTWILLWRRQRALASMEQSRDLPPGKVAV